MSHDSDLNAIQPETEKVTYVGMLGLILLVVGFGGASILGAYLGLKGSISGHKASRVTEGARQINEIQQNESQILNEYKSLENGKYRIPIARAMELIFAEGPSKPASEAPSTDENTLDSTATSQEDSVVQDTLPHNTGGQHH